MADMPAHAKLKAVTLDDKFTQKDGDVFMSGPQAVVRLMLLQHENDRLRGRNTAGFISGYRGSPLGGLDFAFWRARGHLEAANIRFEPGLNEDLAANMVWGTQQVDVLGGGPFDGVFGVWYGKNPGLDRCGDVMKHANMDGTAPNGGVLAISGDDPGAASSSIPNQCEQAFMAAATPLIYPADLNDLLVLGLKGFEMSRYSGLWTGVKLVADVVETSGSITLPSPLPAPVRPADINLPEGGLGGRWPDSRWDQDARVLELKLPAARAFARDNGLDQTAISAGKPVLGIMSAGKPYRDVREALRILGLDGDALETLGIGVRKLGLIWPIEPTGASDFARPFREILVVEEKRGVIEPQLKELAYHWPADTRPRIVGKTDEEGRPLIPETGEISAEMVARVIAERLLAAGSVPEDLETHLRERLARMVRKPFDPEAAGPMRIPHYCAGCPHARSTKLPEGSMGLAGIGCHSMAIWVPDSGTRTITQMGGEGANWVGAHTFCTKQHVFQNMGDGTYYHSGLLAIRAAIAAKTPITYKLLINNAVAMTGGQPVENEPGPSQIAWQLHSEGVERIYLLLGNTDHTTADYGALPDLVQVRERDDLDAVMRECRDYDGVSAILYDQICATEKRRHRKRGKRFQDEPVVVINDRVCEGCGDCSVKSRCIAVRSVNTDFGLKRRIDTSTCNTDLSCMDGFCPSFVTLHGATARARAARDVPEDILADLPAPVACDSGDLYNIAVTGVGGTGLITIGALLGMAAHIEGRENSILDNTGLARKGGAVSTHVRLGPLAKGLVASRIAPRSADLILAGDLASSAGPDGIALAGEGARAVVLDDSVPMLIQAIDPSIPLPTDSYRSALNTQFGDDGVDFVNASAVARAACGDTIFTNMILLGFACQRGFLPVSDSALRRAIELNGIAVGRNLSAFDWGRAVAMEPERVAAFLGLEETGESSTDSLDDRIALHGEELVRYQGQAYAKRYRDAVDRVRRAEAAIDGNSTALTGVVADNLFRLMAIKDEYEVARLLTDPAFERGLKARFEGDYTINYHLAPPFLPSEMTADGRRAKRRFGSWLRPLLHVLRQGRRVRGTVLDPFSYQNERRRERAVLAQYEQVVEELCQSLSAERLAAAVEIAGLADSIKGYGPVKEKALEAYDAALSEKLSAFRIGRGD